MLSDTTSETHKNNHKRCDTYVFQRTVSEIIDIQLKILGHTSRKEVLGGDKNVWCFTEFLNNRTSETHKNEHKSSATDVLQSTATKIIYVYLQILCHTTQKQCGAC